MKQLNKIGLKENVKPVLNKCTHQGSVKYLEKDKGKNTMTGKNEWNK